MDDNNYLDLIEIEGIALDIDETLSWTIGFWVEEMQKRFGNPENLSVIDLIKKYRYTQNVPYWQTIEALNWMNEHRESNEVQKNLPLIKGANDAVLEISRKLPIACYITIRPETVKEGTIQWLQKYGFPDAPVICRPASVDVKYGNKWKAKVLEELYPKVIGIIDDNKDVIDFLSSDYKGKIILYDNGKVESDLDVVSCKTWDNIVSYVEKNYKKN